MRLFVRTVPATQMLEILERLGSSFDFLRFLSAEGTDLLGDRLVRRRENLRREMRCARPPFRRIWHLDDSSIVKKVVHPLE